MKSNAVFKHAYNRTLALLDGYELAADLGPEPSWADRLGVSRTTVRAVLRTLAAAGVVDLDGRRKTLLRRPTSNDRYPDGETRRVRDVVEKQFMRWILHGDCKPGQQINGLELARQFGVSTSAIRDYLSGFSQLGLLERRPNGSWMFRGVTEEFAEELFEVRVMFELRAAQRFIALAETDPVWNALEAIRREHLALREQAETRFTDFSELDERFHRLINDASRNRFIVGFYDVISMIFHYHYQWNKRDEKERNIAAIGEHLAYIDALQSRDRDAATAACRAHMTTARATLMDSIRHFESRN